MRVLVDTGSAPWLLAAAAAATSLVLVARRQPKTPPRYGDAYITLMSNEAKHLLSVPPIQTATLYERVDVPALKARTAAIVAQNPWLLGRLAYGPANTLELQYETSPSNVSEAFVEVHCPLPADAPEEQVAAWLAHAATVGNGHACLSSTRGQVFQVVAAHLTNGSMAIVVALCHVIGDGSTYYRLYKMLDVHEAPAALTPVRAFEDTTASFGALTPHTAPATRTLFVLRRALVNAISYSYRKLLFGSLPQIAEYRVDAKALAAIKAAHVPRKDAPYLSTNDIVASAFFEMTSTALGLMAINLRDRLRLPPSAVGNYVACFVYTRGDYLNPADVRASYHDKTAPQVKMSSEPFPTSLFSAGHFSVMTNWCSFYHHLVLDENVLPIAHMPVIVRGVLPFDATGLLYHRSPSDVRLVTRLATTPLSTPSFLQRV
ncbi:hypothetical protein SPRG_15296 [Saprolegnia parasitica CBS 223.65]|uniref:Condensation domain-containing protein n=1 Tax=Saprolegnia parasitica (strain CBS 223.65) TaxID=695850 RepID=A0A067BRR0_SAPPC|nr:hypothetical protein SPRG_15296 [Saprolegnia parasitica CBS 223.65]KDO19490.1 hypothetical protein SPRG_15296 [Saprolegnia parasitica CBS 223.65]|eukprot:XP_012209794.1 hypothetical protein SPRG_15296 [Saprolegnia parasitica CBS 223.65]